jgi:3-deoxy-manno-octulosonate cytidylyltransferase (CMP-KDO synthetase)
MDCPIMSSIVAIIPARYGSTRLPAKAIASIHGKPLIQWVWEGVKSSKKIDRVIIATDDERIEQAAKSFGAEVVMTSPDHHSGTDRVAEVAKNIDAEWIINIQGDEPLIRGDILDDMISKLGPYEMATLARKIDQPGEEKNPNIVKVVSDLSGRALYFSRTPIPYLRDQDQRVTYWHHLGMYAYRKETLLKLVQFPPSPLEQIEKLEQLRALQNGIAIQVIPTTLFVIGVDTPEDLKAVEQYLSTPNPSIT